MEKARKKNKKGDAYTRLGDAKASAITSEAFNHGGTSALANYSLFLPCLASRSALQAFIVGTEGLVSLLPLGHRLLGFGPLLC